jgi:hypothetical protein
MAGRAIRLIFSYRGDDIRLESRESVEMTAMPSDAVEAPGAQAEFWAELQTADGRALYRRALQRPGRPSIEVPSGDPERPFERRDVEQPEGVFVLVVPDIEAVQSLVVKEARRTEPEGMELTPELAAQAPAVEVNEVLRVDVR